MYVNEKYNLKKNNKFDQATQVTLLDIKKWNYYPGHVMNDIYNKWNRI